MMRRYLNRESILTLVTVLSSAAAVGLLMLPALWNGYPLLFSDSGTYLSSGYGNSIPVDRPILYGLFVRVASLGWTTWLTVVVQSLILFSIFPLLFKHLLQSRRVWIPGAAALAFLAMSTGIAVFASQIMADIFAPAMVLAFIILHYGRDLTRFEKAYLTLVILFSSMVHLSHMGLLFGMIVLVAILDLASVRRYSFPWRKHALNAGLAVSAYVLLAGINAGYGAGFQLSRTQYTVMVGSFIDKGVVQEYFSRHPEPEPSGLYLAIDRIPEKNWQFLWNPESPLYDSIASHNSWVDCWVSREDGFRELIRLILKDDISRSLFIESTLEMIRSQILRFDLGILVPMDSSSVVYPAIAEHFPADMSCYADSRQWSRTLEFRLLSKVQRIAVYISLGVILISLFWVRRIPFRILMAGTVVFAAYFGNAILVATLSTVDERYQARLAWLLPLLAILFVTSLLKPNPDHS